MAAVRTGNNATTFLVNMCSFLNRYLYCGIAFCLLIINVEASTKEEEGFCTNSECGYSETVKTHLTDGTVKIKELLSEIIIEIKSIFYSGRGS